MYFFWKMSSDVPVLGGVPHPAGGVCVDLGRVNVKTLSRAEMTQAKYATRTSLAQSHGQNVNVAVVSPMTVNLQAPEIGLEAGSREAAFPKKKTTHPLCTDFCAYPRFTGQKNLFIVDHLRLQKCLS